ncbi:peroxiredoxin family protein [Cyclobacterium salsum]|uniref:peroxiredoxin family protein n=1 Tax=Cyclobacterium salsum TaxID=2666329 RepID=UPI0013915987|nr:redoxin domain-containing protein [Cyclobacterium salsum]
MKVLILIVLSMAYFESPAQEKVTDFTLPAVGDHEPFILSNAKGNYVALHFLLKTECPYCIRHTNDYIEKSSSLENVIQVFIKPDTEQEIEAWAENLGETPFPIYQDMDANLAERLGIPDGYAFHGQVVHYPALILIDPEGKEVYRYVGKNNSDRLSFKRFKDILDKQ